jgi:pyridoxine/pyridoxamine 5'-phosphate oxidase
MAVALVPMLVSHTWGQWESAKRFDVRQQMLLDPSCLLLDSIADASVVLRLYLCKVCSRDALVLHTVLQSGRTQQLEQHYYIYHPI